MKPGKIVLIVLAVIAALVSGLITLVFWATSGITDTTDEFFAAAREGDYERAYALTSKDLQCGIDQNSLQAFLMSSGLNRVEETSWSSRSIENRSGNLKGEAITLDGATIPLEIKLVKEGEDWRIVHIERDQVGLGRSGQVAIELPSAADQRELLDQTNAVLLESLAEPDLSSFQAIWVDSVTLDDMEGWFSDLRTFLPDLKAVLSANPEFQPATAQNGEGGITMKAIYRNDTGAYNVELSLIPTTGGGWGVYAYNFDLE